MLAVLKARWQTRGWHVMDKKDAEPMAQEFVRELNRHEIPYTAYRELYQRSQDLRAKRLAQGLPCEDFSSDLMIACWPQMKADLREREIAAGRTLTASAETQCGRCFGTGMERIKTDKGWATRKGCTHELLEGEETASASGFDDLEEIVQTAQVVEPETAIDICRRLSVECTKAYAAANGDEEELARFWRAVQVWQHAEKYIRDREAA